MTDPQKVASWPRLQVEIRPEPHQVVAVLRINGAPHDCAAPTVEGIRAGIIARCATLATTLGRAVALDVDESGQRYRLAVRPNGVVQPLEVGNSIGDAARLAPVSAPCRQCQQAVTVTDATCRACGVTAPLRVELAERAQQASPAAAQRSQALPALTVQIGNGAATTTTAPTALGWNPDAIDGHSRVIVPSSGMEVSKTHALVDVDDAGRLIVTDHDSATGTYVDGRALTPHTPTIIAASARLQLGPVDVRIHSVAASNPQPSTQS